MPSCIAFTQHGPQCTYSSRIEFEGHYCMTHFNKKLRDEPAFKARYDAHIQEQRQAEEARDLQRVADEIARAAQLEAARQAEMANEAARAQQIQDRKARKNTKLINDAHMFSPDMIISYTHALMNMWDTTLMPGMEIAKAYVLLKFRTSTHDGFPVLMRAVTRMVRQSNGHHPIHTRYADVPIEERTQAFESLLLALNAYGEFTNTDLLELLPLRDVWRATISRRIAAVEAEARRQIELAQLNHNLIHNPVVFRRDPEGSIDLLAFSQDNQSVHRSSVQSATQRAISTIIDRPLLENQDTLSEIIVEFNRPHQIRWFGDRMCERAITELTNDYYNCEAFSVKYGIVLDHVWAFITSHVHKTDLIIRLAQEVCEGIKQCTNGKMARLINVLQGYDETLEIEPPKELFQGRIALLMNRPLEEREAQAQALFLEFNIPEDQRANWLDPLLEV